MHGDIINVKLQDIIPCGLLNIANGYCERKHRDFVEQRFKERAMAHVFEIEEIKIADDHVHIFLGFLPKYSISNVVKRLKGSSARAVFQKYPEVKRELL